MEDFFSIFNRWINRSSILLHIYLKLTIAKNRLNSNFEKILTSIHAETFYFRSSCGKWNNIKKSSLFIFCCTRTSLSSSIHVKYIRFIYTCTCTSFIIKSMIKFVSQIDFFFQWPYDVLSVAINTVLKSTTGSLSRKVEIWPNPKRNSQTMTTSSSH
jgi:hypothetical protein